MFIPNALLWEQVDKTQSPVFAVYASSLHRHGKSLRAHDETDSPDVTQVICCRGQLCRRVSRRAERLAVIPTAHLGSSVSCCISSLALGAGGASFG
jgi:hypothetical protein